MSARLHLIGACVCSPLGPSLALHGAATAAGMDAFVEHAVVCDASGEPVVVSQASFLEQSQAAERMQALAELAADACSSLLAGCAPTAKPVPCAIWLPAPRSGLAASELAAITSALGSKLPSPPRQLAPGFASLFAEWDSLREQFEAGRCDYALLGAVDSLVDEGALRALAQANRLLGPDNPWGGIPGEAACFLLLARQPTGTSLALGAYGLARGTETDPPGNALGGLFARLGTALPEGRRFEALHSGNDGDRDLAQEFELACMKSAEAIARDASVFKPIGQWGDLGTAFLPLLLAQLWYSHHKQDQGERDILVWAAGENATRGAIWVEVNHA